MTVRVVATGDVHSPVYLQLYLAALREAPDNIDLVLWAGDMVEKNDVYALRPVLDYTRRKYVFTPIVAVFGNEEYRGYEDEYRRRYPGVRWLDDEYFSLTIHGLRIGIVGGRGALDKPTPWQARNIPGIAEYYRSLPEKLRGLAEEHRGEVDIMILLLHYGVTYRNLQGEKTFIYPYLASRRMEKIINPGLFDIVIHAHAHQARIPVTYVNNVPVYNVSLPARGKLVEITLEPVKRGLLRWLG